MSDHSFDPLSNSKDNTEPKELSGRNDFTDGNDFTERMGFPQLDDLPRQISQVAEELVHTLIQKSLHISLAESCTGGLATASIVSVPGSSAILDASVVTYANHAKTRYADVPEETLAAFGAVSEETAGAMARGIALENDANLGIGISGIAGPGGGTPDKPIGTVCFGIYYRESVSQEPARSSYFQTAELTSASGQDIPEADDLNPLKETLITITEHFGDLGRDHVRALSVYFALSQALRLLK